MKAKFILVCAILLGTAATDITFDNTACMAASKKTTTKKSRYDRFKGTVGKYKVTMFLDSTMNGYYYYGNGAKGKLTIKGELIGCGAHDANYTLYEYNSAGQCTGVWDVNIGNEWLGPGKYLYRVGGEMTTADGRTYNVYLEYK